MLQQYSLSLKIRYSLRLLVFTSMIVLNIVFAICGLTDVYGNAGKITAVSLSSIIFCVWLVACAMADDEILKSLFAAPKGYLTFLAPIKSWKVLLARLLAILTWDIPGFVLGVAGIVVQSFLLSDLSFSILLNESSPFYEELLSLLYLLLHYILFVLFSFLGYALMKSVFFTIKARWFFGTISSIFLYYILTWFDLLLTPFASLSRHGLLFIISFLSLNYWAVGICLLLLIAKIACVFYITSYLMDRKVNLG